MNEITDNRIEQYNLGHLAGPELERFEAEMQADPELAQAVAEQRTAWEMGELLAEERLRGQIRARFAKAALAPEKPFFKHWKFVFLGLLMLGVAAFFLFKNAQNGRPEPAPNLPKPQILPEKTPAETAPTTPEKPKTEPAQKFQKPIAGAARSPNLRTLALASYHIPNGLASVRGADEDGNLSLAAKAFSEKSYARAVELLKVLPDDDRQVALSLRAHAHFGAGQFDEAIRDFSELEAGGMYRREAEWFGVLARLAENPKDDATLLSSLENIAQNGRHPFRANAETLLGSISRTKK